MEVRYINPFLTATVNVIKTMAFIEVKAGKPFLKKDNLATGDVTGIIGITGETEGSMSVSFSEACILAIVSNMFGEKIEAINEEVEDAVGEITNMISGDARRSLDDAGINLKAAIPSVVSGKSHHVRHITTSPVVAIPFETQAGSFTIEVCFNK